MRRAIVGFRLEIAAWRGTIKLGQNKPEAARLAAADGAEASGRRGIAHWMRARRMTRLAIFDCDGTLVDSQANICRAVEEAFADARARGAAARRDPADRRAEPGRGDAGAAARRGRRATTARWPRLTRTAFVAMRASGALDEEPLFDGIARVGRARSPTTAGCSASRPASPTAASRTSSRTHGLAHHFVTLQTADRHPSKPHPSMIEAAIAEAGADPATTAMIGDTSYDMMMAVNAGRARDRRRLGLSPSRTN